MPTVVNGIGTWYYGKSRIHTRKGTCEFCQRLGELQSYDTTLYFVVVFIPVIPLGRKRILEQCPYCQKHRIVTLKQWEEGKANAVAEQLQRLQDNPDDREAIQSAIAVAVAYQDEALFDKLAPALAGHRLDDAAIQTQLGGAYSYFARWPEAEAAYRAALAVQDDPGTREQLAFVLLKQGRPEEAQPYLEHILRQPDPNGAGMIYLLIEGYQAQGMHEEALSLIERRDQAFPAFAETKEYKQQRKLAEKHRSSGKKITSTLLGESRQVGYREGGWTAKLPRIFGPVIIGGLFIWYLAAAISIGQHRKVFFVNGQAKPYTVAVNGQAVTLPVGQTLIEVPEGEVSVEFRDANMQQDPIHVEVETNFFARPFTSPTFVINPDRLALLIWEETEYSERPNPTSEKHAFHIGKEFYSLGSIDYPFGEFPQSLSMKKGTRLHKTRIFLPANVPPEGRLNVIAQALSPEEQIAYAQRWLRQEPNDTIFLYWILDKTPAPAGIRYLQTRLGERPVLVEWHRAYQSLVERENPEIDLKPEYRRLMEETHQQPDTVYLLARLLDGKEAEKLLEQAAAASPPSVQALHALGWRAMGQGRFSDAVKWMAKAMQFRASDIYVRRDYHSALLAAAQYDQLLESLKQPTLTGHIYALYEQARVHAIRGDKAKFEETLKQAQQLWPDPGDAAMRSQIEAGMRMVQSCCINDTAGYLREAIHLPNPPGFQVAFLRGNLKEAAANLTTAKNTQVNIERGLLYLAATKTKNATLADEQWKALLEALRKTGRHERRFAEQLGAPQASAVDVLINELIEPGEKRVLLAVAAARWPAHAKELLTMAKKLNFQRDAISLCLNPYLEIRKEKG